MKNDGKSRIVSVTVPEKIKDILDIVGNIGYYDSLSEFIRDAIRTHLQEKRHVFVLIVYNLYIDKKVSLAQAGAMLKLSLEEIKELFNNMEV